ncbi:hypothetical protein [Paenibacillus cremeus]|uniref:hypothetical protein n=1 Tax=Paenibacillus cremeus TaxID=2163881 RepID=UPI001644E4F9|nr:hypothetical protein [Paenibacillus cremeus]
MFSKVKSFVKDYFIWPQNGYTAYFPNEFGLFPVAIQQEEEEEPAAEVVETE